MTKQSRKSRIRRASGTAGLIFFLALCVAPLVTADSAITPPQPPPQSFIWVGHPERGFTRQELQYIAEHYALVVLAKFHGKWNVEKHHADARTLKALNPDIKVFPYYSMSYRFKRDRFGTGTFNERWILRDDETGNMVAFMRSPKRTSARQEPTFVGWLVDLGQEPYRKWALGILAGWLAAAPYDGVAFDNAVPIRIEPHRLRRQLVNTTLSPETVDAWNDGLKTMLAGAGVLGNKRREVIFNGIADTITRVNRSLDLYEYADTAMNEQFCVGKPTDGKRQVFPEQTLANEIDLMMRIAANGKKLLQKTNYKSEEKLGKLLINKAQLARFCYGVFLMGYTPGSHYYKFGIGYSALDGEIRENAVEMSLPLGGPIAPYRKKDRVWARRFEGGVVYVNPSKKSRRTISLDDDLVLMNGNVNHGKFSTGSRITIPAQDALFLLKSAVDSGGAAANSCDRVGPWDCPAGVTQVRGSADNL